MPRTARKAPAVVFILRGHTGIYEDRSAWDVSAYTGKDAEARATTDRDFLNSIAEEFTHGDDCGKREAVRDKLRQYDPTAYVDYTGTTYHVHKVAEFSRPVADRMIPPTPSGE